MRVPPPSPRRRKPDLIGGAVAGGVGLGCFLYLLGFVAFWVGVIYLIWRLALSH